MEDDLISIVVPIYNVQKYLDRCINSLISQTYKNIEIILVDDGSPDKSGEICDIWKAKDSRIKVIHKRNGGLSDARNIGIEEAKGKYISLVDSDDYVHVRFLEILHKLCVENNSDISMCGNYITSKEEDWKCKIVEEGIRNINCREALENRQIPYCVAWNKLYRSDIIKKIKYPKGKIHEDVAIIYELLYNSINMSITDTKLYYYFENKDSIMRREYSRKRLDILDVLEKAYESFAARGEIKIANNILNDYIDAILEQYKNVCEYDCTEKKEIKKELKEKYKYAYIKLKKNKRIKGIDLAKYMIYKYVPNLYVCISK